MAQQIDLLIDKEDISEFSSANELKLLAQLNAIKSTAASIEKPADPEISKTRKTVSVQAAQDNSATGTVTTSTGRTTTATSHKGAAVLLDSFLQNPTNYLLMLIAFLLFVNLIIHD